MPPTEASAATSSRAAWWNDARVRGVFYQLMVLGGVGLLAAYLVNNTLSNLEARNIATGWGFLEREAGFAISESPIDYGPADTYFRALLAGLLNTLKVSLIGIVLATLLGTIAGVARLSSNWLVAKIATVYVESLRNVPILLQLFFWAAVIKEGLPHPRQALSPVDGVLISNRGLFLPEPVWETTHTMMGVALGVGIVGSWIVARWAKKRQEQTGQPFPVMRAALGLIIGLPLVAYVLGGAPTALNVPELKGFNIQGGVWVSPEFTALLTGLVMYTGTYIAEIVRGGVLSVSWGQSEAGLALGLRRSLVMRLILLPQALRVIIPPLTSQYLNLAKNSSLAVAIGFPDVVAIANTSINQTGQAVEGIAIIMAVYLTVSLSISAFMNWYNRKIALQGGGR